MFFRKKVIIEATNNDQESFDIKSDGYVDITTKDYIMYPNVHKSDIDISRWGDNGKIQNKF